jgi:NAD(P) transhydrogenase subunit alpha
MTKEGTFNVPMDDDIVAACLITQNGESEERLNMDLLSPTVTNLIIFVLAIYVGYHVVWTVTPALHTPLMSVTNAISAIVIVGAMLAAALTEGAFAKGMGVLAVALAAVNVFGGFLVTRRMLEMFKKKERAPVAKEPHLEGNKS